MARLQAIYKDYSACCNDFSLGIECLEQRALSAAVGCFKRAYIGVDEKHGMRSMYLSYYGFARILNGDYAGLDLCRQAADHGGADADILYLLARAEMFCHNRQKMVEAIRRGMQLNPQHTGLQLLQHTVGYRKFNPLPFLSRRHLLNRGIGRLLRKTKTR